jgi:hypothetical protein
MRKKLTKQEKEGKGWRTSRMVFWGQKWTDNWNWSTEWWHAWRDNENVLPQLAQVGVASSWHILSIEWYNVVSAGGSPELPSSQHELTILNKGCKDKRQSMSENMYPSKKDQQYISIENFPKTPLNVFYSIIGTACICEWFINIPCL